MSARLLATAEKPKLRKGKAAEATPPVVPVLAQPTRPAPPNTVVAAAPAAPNIRRRRLKRVANTASKLGLALVLDSSLLN